MPSGSVRNYFAFKVKTLPNKDTNTQLLLDVSFIGAANAAVRSGPPHQHRLQTPHTPLHCRLHSFPDKIRAEGRRRGVSRTLGSDVPHLHWCTDGRQRFTPLPGCFPLTAWQTGPVGFGRHSRSIHLEPSGTAQETTHTNTHHFLPTCALPASTRQNVRTGNITKREINIFPVTVTTHPTAGGQQEMVTTQIKQGSSLRKQQIDSQLTKAPAC